MYSYEDRIRAVKLYIKLGKRAATTVRLLGYPSQKYLRQWFLTYQETGDLPRSYNRPPKYTMAQKQKAIEHYFNHGECFAYTQRVLGYPCAHVFGDWLKEFQPDSVRKRINNNQAQPKPAITYDKKKKAVLLLII